MAPQAAPRRIQATTPRSSPPEGCSPARTPTAGAQPQRTDIRLTIAGSVIVGLRRVPALLMALRVDTRRGLVLLTVDPYDASVVDAIRELPERRYRHRSREWCVPATREHLRAVNTTLAELEERGIAIEMTKDANARFARAGIGRAIVRDNAIEISGPYSRRRLPALRSLPERRYDPDRRRWMIALTRAGALAILALVDDGYHELVATRRARRALQRATAPATAESRRARDAPSTPKRRSPRPHWRHYTAGPVFENPDRPRLYVQGIGWCVRIRVGPREPKGMA